MGRSPGRRGSRPDERSQGESAGWPDWADPTAIAALRNDLRSGHVAHSYLLSGPKGVGKQALARALCQAICCTDNDGGDRSIPCGACRTCRNVANGSHSDVEWFGLEAQAALAEKPGRGANLTIDTIRRLRGTTALMPLESPRRILVVDDADTMQEPAQQALLKTLEEPPPLVSLVLLADEPDALLATVRSRCRQIQVRPVADSVIERALIDRRVDPLLAGEIAALSRGRPAWAVAAAKDPRLLKSRREEQGTAAEWLRATPYERLVTAYRLGEQFTKRRAEVFGLVQAATQILRVEMIGSAAGATSEDDRPAVFDRDRVTADALGMAVAASLQCLADLDANVRPRLALEAMVMAWPNPVSQQA